MTVFLPATAASFVFQTGLFPSVVFHDETFCFHSFHKEYDAFVECSNLLFRQYVSLMGTQPFQSLLAEMKIEFLEMIIVIRSIRSKDDNIHNLLN